MCGRYNFTAEESREIMDIIREVQEKHPDEPVKYGEIYPTNQAAILLGKENEIRPDLMKWGFPNFRNKGVIINARAETVYEKKMFRDSVLFRRCIVPTTGFYEWDQQKQKFLFTLPGKDETYLAGFYNEFKGEPCYVILTTDANESMKGIHHRMPVILQKDQLTSWVFDQEQSENILKTVPPILEKRAVS